MRILLRLQSGSELHSYEGMALALTLATFGHTVQVWLGEAVCGQLLCTHSRLSGMIQSLNLYEMPKAWVNADVHSSWLLGMVDEPVSTQLELCPEQINLRDFDQILSY